MIWARLPVPVRQFMTMRPSSELRKACCSLTPWAAAAETSRCFLRSWTSTDGFAFVMLDKIDGVAASRTNTHRGSDQFALIGHVGKLTFVALLQLFPSSLDHVCML